MFWAVFMATPFSKLASTTSSSNYQVPHSTTVPNTTSILKIGWLKMFPLRNECEPQCCPALHCSASRPGLFRYGAITPMDFSGHLPFLPNNLPEDGVGFKSGRCHLRHPSGHKMNWTRWLSVSQSVREGGESAIAMVSRRYL